MLTPAVKYLKDHKIDFKEYEYECTVDHDYGKFAAKALNLNPKMVYKSIVLVFEKTFITAVTPVDAMISLKSAARLLKLKSLEIASPQDAQRITGPFGQKRQTKILLCQSALEFDEILVSGGRRGYSVGINPNDLVSATNATVGDFLDHKS